jgi:hypothetical protein
MVLIFPGDGIDINLPGLTGGSKTFLVTSMGLSHQTRNAPYVGTNDNRVLRRITCEYGPVLANGYDFFAGLVSAKGGGAGGGSGSPGAAWSDAIYLASEIVEEGDNWSKANKIVLCPPGKRFKITEMVAGLGTAPSSADLILDVQRATAAAPSTWATVIHATDTNKLVVEVGETIGKKTAFAIPYLYDGDRLRDDVIQADGAAANLRVQIFGQFVPL